MDSKTIGSRYKIIQPLCEGGFGTTYLAEDIQSPHNQQCVVKQLHSDAEDPEFLAIARRMFIKEAQTLAKLGKHAQIPHLLAYFEEEGEFYLVQQYIRGATLTHELTEDFEDSGKGDRQWSEVEVIELLQDLLQILDFVHQNGVIHRDVKPDNLIRRTLDGKLVLVDFGTVKEVMLTQYKGISSTVSVGTQGYMPNEQARGKPRFASDIYAAGMIAIQALTGVFPLDLPEDRQGEIIWQDRAKCSPLLGEIVSKMVRYHFKDRYHSAREILTNLAIAKERLANGLGQDTTGIVNSQSRTTQGNAERKQWEKPRHSRSSTHKTRRNKFIPIAIGTLVLLTGVAGGVYLLNSDFRLPIEFERRE